MTARDANDYTLGQSKHIRGQTDDIEIFQIALLSKYFGRKLPYEDSFLSVAATQLLKKSGIVSTTV